MILEQNRLIWPLRRQVSEVASPSFGGSHALSQPSKFISKTDFLLKWGTSTA